MATRLIPPTTQSIHRPGSLASPSFVEITSRGAGESFHLDTGPGEAQGLPSPSASPAFASHPEPSPGLDDALRTPERSDVTLAGTTGTDAKPDSTPEALSPTGVPSLPSPATPHEVTAPTSATASRGERAVWTARARPRGLWVEEDGGVRLAGGPPSLAARRGGEPEVAHESGAGWEVLPPPYYHFG